MQGKKLIEFLEVCCLQDLRNKGTLESGLASAMVKELGTDSAMYSDSSLDCVLSSYIGDTLRTKFILCDDEIVYIGFSLIRLISEDIAEHIDYIRDSCINASDLDNEFLSIAGVKLSALLV